ncbi:CocE/NonD family hydrolase [Rhodococcus sp. IEGM 1307]|uniref:CocE/NonD family hydrolase n=1 Tax=Rhodococcus sp. IEGM 1307 TaxID=3047091 RepID=UPI0024B861CB|nr:CocE/NonD family hydrolase [Rhodococcus sp. IEGM 1307]MDI9977204.1 CocE/NonD family hydrolase [Rhodococcus sp. IEGM 1307]
MDEIKIELNVEVPMRDGTILRADVYRPADSDVHPVLLHRTPYDKTNPMTNYLQIDVIASVKRGFIVVLQDTRARYASEGEWLPWAHERNDGYDTVQWASVIAGSNGKVGMFGKSYGGQTQWAAAVAGAPSLAAMAPQVTWSDPEDGLLFRGGAIELGMNTMWGLGQALGQIPKVSKPEDIASAMSVTAADVDNLVTKTYWELPAAKLPAITRSGLPDLGVSRALDDPATIDESRNEGHFDQVTVPSLNIGGWYDLFTQGTLNNYVAMRERGIATQLVMGPWAHMHIPALEVGQVGEVNFGMSSIVPPTPGVASLSDLQLDWFDRYLGLDSLQQTDSAPVRIFVMGINEWRDEPDWPLERAVETPLYLRAEGVLSFDAPEEEDAHSEFTYDPADPVPTCGGALFMANEFPPGPKEQRNVENRTDVMVFSSAVFDADLEITGQVRAQICAATDGPSTDWVVRLCDVDELGRSYNIVDGITRAATEAGRIDTYEIDLWSTSIVIKAGHRLRVHVTSSSFPRWDRNLNSGDTTTLRTAHQTVHHDATRPSRLLLPVIPRR